MNKIQFKLKTKNCKVKSHRKFKTIPKVEI